MPNNPVIAVIGVGTIGLVIVYHFGFKYPVIGFDNDRQRIDELNKGFDKHKMFDGSELSNLNITFTSNPDDIAKSNFYIIAVPTKFRKGKPDLSNLLNASEMLGRYLKKGDIVVYESTVYPGVTEEDCIPLLEKTSGLKSPTDFAVGYSPERINPGDKDHNLCSVKKIIAAQNQATLKTICEIYEDIIEAGVVPVSSIKIAESTKIVENTQRDVQISFFNEAALMLHKMGIDSKEVFSAMSTKWNYVPFLPGLVGGTCIGKDSNYLIYKSSQEGYYPNLVIAARHINDYMGKYIADQTIKHLLQKEINLLNARIAVCGITFKENYNDTENSRVFDIIKELQSFNTNVIVHDPIADDHLVKTKYGVNLTPWEQINEADAIIFAVSHQQYCTLSKDEIMNKLNKKAVIVDVKCIFNKNDFSTNKDLIYWQL